MIGLDVVVEYSYSFFLLRWIKIKKKMVVLKENVVSVD